jgi:hypothetical protein
MAALVTRLNVPEFICSASELWQALQ